jgi:hypothetical protein
MRRRTLLIAAVMAVAWCAFTPDAQAGEPGARPTKDMFNEVCRSAADSLLRQCGLTRASSVQIRFASGERTLFFRSVLLDAVAAQSAVVYAEGSRADTIITLGIEDAQVAYGTAFRERWFGERKTERTAALAVRLEMQQRSTGKILFAGTLRRAAADTIAVEEAARAGASSRDIAVGNVPASSLWEKILEPAILTVSSGIAIYLFFTVRS